MASLYRAWRFNERRCTGIPCGPIHRIINHHCMQTEHSTRSLHMASLIHAWRLIERRCMGVPCGLVRSYLEPLGSAAPPLPVHRFVINCMRVLNLPRCPHQAATIDAWRLNERRCMGVPCGLVRSDHRANQQRCATLAGIHRIISQRNM